MRTKDDYQRHVAKYLAFKGYKHREQDRRAFANQAWIKQWGKLRTNAECERAFRPPGPIIDGSLA